MKKLSVVSVTACALVTGMMQSAQAAVVLGAAQGYEASLSGSIPVFLSTKYRIKTNYFLKVRVLPLQR